MEDLAIKYQNTEALYPLLTGGEVVDQYIDENNQLNYIIRENGEYRANKAINEQPDTTYLPKTSGETVKITF